MIYNKPKTIVLAVPNDYELHKLIKENFEFYGFEVILLLSNPPFKYNSLKDKLLNFIKKNFFKDYKFKQKLVSKHNFEWQLNQLLYVDNFDYGLFIRADFFDDRIINLVKNKVNHLVSYHYDGLERSPKIFDKISFFNNFFVFEKKDLIKCDYRLLSCTNFYFDFDKKNQQQFKNEIDFYFLGSHHESRINDIIEFKKKCDIKGYSSNFEIVINKKDVKWKKLYSLNNINCLSKTLPFKNYIEQIRKSKIIIDFVIDEHLGLSFRVFESIKYEKKLITTNKSIVNYDFYNPNNIFIFDRKNIKNEDINAFINSDYQKLPLELVEKYSFKNWMNYILNIEPYQSITIN
jgi:hypothetical protein